MTGGGSPPGAQGASPWLAPYSRLIEEVGTPDSRHGWIESLDAAAQRRDLRSGGGKPLRFVPALSGDGQAYEARIFETGEVPTRTRGEGRWHDWFNALVWLAFARTKSRLNALQARALATHGVRAERGRVRDAATLFDENAALFIATRDAPVRALRAFDWHALFVARRAAFGAEVRVVLFGHALMQKLRAPYKSICAHAWVMRTAPDGSEDGAWLPAACGLAGSAAWDAFDAALAESLTPQSFEAALARSPPPQSLGTALARSPTPQSLGTARSGGFTPLPVLGVPGWWPANESPAFYNDPGVFRPGRRRVSANPQEKSRCTSSSPAAPDSSASS